VSFQLGLGDLVRAGGRAVSRYTGTVLALFIAQSLVAGVAIVTVAQIFASELAQRPMFDDAVDGDLVSLVHILRDMPHIVWAAGWTMFGVVLVWMIASWFLVGGTLAVLADRPEGRAATARTFGAGGANTFLSFVALQVLSLVAYLPALFVLGFGLAWGLAKAEYALTIGDLVSSVGLGVLPGLLALAVAGTVVDYARVELAVRKSSHELGAIAAFIRAIGFVITNPITIVHSLLGWILTIAVGLAYVWLSHGRSLLGGSGALTILIVRQGLALVRMAIKVGVLGGQVELGQTRPPPPRRQPAQSSASSETDGGRPRRRG
jgi:hypothetical protein